MMSRGSNTRFKPCVHLIAGLEMLFQSGAYLALAETHSRSGVGTGEED